MSFVLNVTGCPFCWVNTRCLPLVVIVVGILVTGVSKVFPSCNVLLDKAWYSPFSLPNWLAWKWANCIWAFTALDGVFSCSIKSNKLGNPVTVSLVKNLFKNALVCLPDHLSLASPNRESILVM